jgi:c-di-GMP-binding flagellar brake protein YcgR
MTNQSATERRESFRIDMMAYVAAEPKTEALPDPTDYFKTLQSIALVSELNVLEQEFNLISERIKDLASKKSIDLLHRQVEILSRLNVDQTLQSHSLTSQLINISEGGCSVAFEQEYKAGDIIAIGLVLHPNFFTIFTFAEVINSNFCEGHFQTHLNFTALSDRQEQQLMKHMFQAQTESKKHQVNTDI